MQQDWLSNAYLVGDEENGKAVAIDSGGPSEPLLEAADRHGLDVEMLLLTHHHGDHISALGDTLERYPDATVLAHPDERVPGSTGDLHPGDELTIGGLTVKALHTPGHTAGMLNLLVDGKELFTGDTLFKGSVGGVRAPGSTSFEDIKHSIMEVILTLPPETVLRPGHTEPSTVGDELEHNPFVRIWRGLDPEGHEGCTALGDPATLVLWGPDYDGGHKAWVRWPDGRDDIVPGSKVER